VIDNSINNNYGTLYSLNSPSWVNEDNGYYSFDGDDDYIEVSDSTDFDLLTESTMSLWAKTTLEYPSEDSNIRYKGIISKSVSGYMGGFSYFIDWRGTNTSRSLRTGISDGTVANYCGVENFDFDSKWQHIVVTRDLDKLKIYVNGNLENSVDNTIGEIFELDKKLEIGRAFNSNAYSFNGNIDDVKIYNRSLSSDEIKYQYDMAKYKYN
jgi:hypothetical protein